MQTLDLNLASRPFRNNTLLWVGYGLSVALLLAFTAWNVQTYTEHRNRLGDMRVTLSDIEDKLRDLDRRRIAATRVLNSQEHDLGVLNVQSAKANDVIDRKAFSWTRLFNRLEQAQPWNVYMVSIRPLFQRERTLPTGPEGASTFGIPIAVEGFAKSLNALFAFERAVFDEPYFAYPEPERHAPNDQGEILFTMRFLYYPDGQASTAEPVAEEGQEPAEPAPAEGLEAVEAELPDPGAGAAEGEAQQAAPGSADEPLPEPTERITLPSSKAKAKAQDEPLDSGAPPYVPPPKPDDAGAKPADGGGRP